MINLRVQEAKRVRRLNRIKNGTTGLPDYERVSSFKIPELPIHLLKSEVSFWMKVKMFFQLIARHLSLLITR